MKYGTERKDNIQTMKKLSEQGRIIREGGKRFGYRGRCLSFCDGIFPFFMESIFLMELLIPPVLSGKYTPIPLPLNS